MFDFHDYVCLAASGGKECMVKMKKVLFLIKSLEGGGAEKVLLNYLIGLNNQNIDITVKTVFNIGIYINQLPSNVRYETIIKKPTKFKMRVVHNLLTYLPDFMLRKIFLNKNTYDIEISFLEGNQCKLISSAPKNIKKIAWIHQDISKLKENLTGFKNFKCEFNCYKKFDKIICVSNDVKNNFEKKFKNKIPASTIYNPINTNDIISKAGDIKKDYSVIRICSIGRLVEAKRFDRLIEVTKNLKNLGYNIKTTILGEGILRDKLEKMIDLLELNNNVELIGFQENPYSYLASSDIFICTSDNEGFSLVVAEALVLGIAVISTNCSGPTELLENGKYGKIVGKSTSALTDAVVNMIEKEEIKKYSNLAKERSKIFDMQTSMIQLLKLMEK